MDDQSQNYRPADQQQYQTEPAPPETPTTPRVEDDTEDDTEVVWRASEYIHHDKGLLWYVVLGLVTLAAAVTAALFQQWILAVLMVVMGIALGVYANRRPHEVTYRISDEGIAIGNQFLPYEEFRSFGIVSEGAFYALQLRPTRRFLPSVTMYFADADGERIVDALGEHLPMEEMRPDAVDRFMRWLRF